MLDQGGKGTAEISLPAEIRNALVRFRISGESTAGAVQLLDARWQRKSVGLVAGEGADESQPLLDPLTYVQRALAPTSDLVPSNAPSTSEAVKGLIDRGASVIVLTETGTLPPDTSSTLVKWIEDGGTLIRFASPNLAATNVDSLLPVRLRQGERALGGSLSWEEPQPIGGFSETGPFAHIAVPNDVTVNRQVLADPDALREAEVWAELRDGTPLVTAATRGKGRIVLFHVTADPRWSNLPLSGAFVGMLNAIVDMAGTVSRPPAAGPDGAPQATASPWKPVEVLDGYGNLAAPPPAQRSSPTSKRRSQARRPSWSLRPRRNTLRAKHREGRQCDRAACRREARLAGERACAGTAARHPDLALGACRGGRARHPRWPGGAGPLRAADAPLCQRRGAGVRLRAHPSGDRSGVRAGPRDRNGARRHVEDAARLRGHRQFRDRRHEQSRDGRPLALSRRSDGARTRRPCSGRYRQRRACLLRPPLLADRPRRSRRPRPRPWRRSTLS